MIFIDIFLFKIDEIVLLILVYHTSEDLEEEQKKKNYDTTYNNSLDFLDNEYSDQENWFNGEW